jgi:hypothetical protein
MTRPRLAALWLLVGLVSIGMVMLNDVGRLLADVQNPGAPSFDPWVFTGPKGRFWDSTELRAAIGVWQQLATASKPLLSLHVLIDGVLVIPWYCMLIYLGLQSVSHDRGLALWLALGLGIADAIETAATYFLIADAFSDSKPLLGFLQAMTLLKWLLLAASLVTMFTLWLKPIERTASAEKLVQAVAAARQGLPQHPAIALLGLLGIVALFAALVAVPAGGPMEQIPDVIR